MIVGDQQRAVAQFLHVHRPAPGVAASQPALGEGLPGLGPAGLVEADARQAVAVGDGAVPGTVLGDDGVMAVLGGKLGAPAGARRTR